MICNFYMFSRSLDPRDSEKSLNFDVVDSEKSLNFDVVVVIFSALFSEERQVPFVNLPGVIRLVSYALGAARSSLRTGCDHSKENPIIPR